MASELCITKDAILQKPDGGLTYPASAQQITPFIMNGAPLSIHPQSLTGLTEFRRKNTATKDTSNLVAYFAADNYYLINLASENIFGPDPNTSLRFQNRNFTLKFMAIHSSIWEKSGIQISLLFTTADGNIFHICIPITFDGSDTTANPILNSIFTGNSLPSGSTMNQILNFGDPKTNVSFATLEYCLLYNKGTILKPYTFCIFNNPLKAALNSLPAWLASDRDLKNKQDIPTPQTSFNSYRRKTFDEILNYFMKNVINVYVYDTVDPYLIGIEQHFDASRTQNATSPTYFQVTTKVLSGTKLSSFSRGDENGLVRGLDNVKCYPIDLATQIDTDGNIFIDEKSNKPINVKDVMADQNGGEFAIDISGNPTLGNSQSWVRFIIAFSIIFLILLAIIVIVVVYIFRGTSFNKTQFLAPVTGLSGAVAAVPIAAVPIAAAPSSS